MADEITPKEEVAIEATIEPIFEPMQAPETQTAQILVNEPLDIPIEIEVEPIIETIPDETKIIESEIKPKPTPESISETVTEEIKPEISEPIKPELNQETKFEPEQSKPSPEIIPVVVVIPKSKSLARELLVKARNMIQFRKRKKLDKIMTLFAKQTKITNDEVEKFLHVSDATATRYLSQLEKEGKIKQNGKTGKWVSYSKI